MIETVRLVAWREIKEKLRDRSFLLFTAFIVLVAIGGPILIVYLDESETREYAVDVTGEGSELLGNVIEQQAQATGKDITLRRLPNAAAAERVVENDEVDAAIVGGERVLVEGSLDPNLEVLLQSSAQGFMIAQVLQSTGASPQQIEAVLDPEPLAVRDLDGGEGGIGEGTLAVTSAGLVLLFLTVFLYGYWIASGVVEEKASRVVEVVLSAVRPSHLLAGKIVGIGLLGLLQLILVAAVGLVATLIAGLDLPAATFEAVGAVLLWFVLGYAFYGCLFAVAGSLVSRQEDLQYTQYPMMILIFVGYGAAFYQQVGNLDPLLAQVLSFVPPFTPMLMLVRMSLGEVGTLEVVASVLLMAAATAGLVALAARLYAGSVLRFGARVSLGEAWRSLRPSTKDGREVS